MSSSLDDALMEATLQDFSRQLHSAFPPRNFGEFHGEEQLKEKILQLKEDVSKNFFSKVWNRDREQVFSLLKKLRNRMDKEVIAEWMAKNKEHKMGSVSCLLKRAEMLCEDFQIALEDQLLQNPHMEIDSFKNFVDQQKEFAVNYFDGIWEAGCSQIKKERQAKMIKNLNVIWEELLDKHKHFLQSLSVKEGKNLVGEVKTILVEKSRLLKSYVDSHQGQVSKRYYLKAEVEGMKEYLLNGKGSILREGQKEIYSKLMEALDDGIKFLTEEEVEGNANSPKGFSQWMEGLYLGFKKYCFNPTDEMGTDDGQGTEQGRAECVSSERPRWITMQRILREDSCGSWEQEVEPENITPVERGNDNVNENIIAVEETERTSSRAYDQSEPATSGKRTMRRRRSRPFNSSVRDNDQTLVDGKNEAATHDSQAKKRRIATDANIPWKRKTTKKTDSSVQTSKVNKTTDSVQLMQSRRSNRIKKKLVEPDLTPETTVVPDNANSQSSSLILDEMSGGEDENTVTTYTLQHSSFNPDQITILGVDPPLYQCKLCKKKYKTKCFIRYHRKNCNQEHICGQCGKVFRKKCNYIKHLRTHTDEKPFKCPTCNKQFGRKTCLRVHMLCHTEASFHCEKCQRVFRHRYNLNRHMLYHERKLPFACSYCDHRCTSLTDLKAHVLIHSDERPFNCTTCKRQFCMKYQLIRHLQRIHGLPREDADKQANDVAREYLRKVMKNPNYDGDTSSMFVVSHAIKEANLRISDEPDGVSSVKATSSRRSIRLDQITILGGDTYKCDVCGKVIQWERFLKCHGRNCRERRNICDHCGKKFAKPSELVDHRRTHTEEKPFECSTCNKQFANRSNLRTHNLSHSREVRFPCPKCKLKFSQRSNLESHMLKHEDKLPFGCSYCDQRCATLGLLKEHVVMVHCDERPFKCPTCGRSFSCKQRLVRHIHRLHHQSRKDALKLANEAGVEYLRKENQVFNDTVFYSLLESVVLSHAIKKANLKLCEPTSPSKS